MAPRSVGPYQLVAPLSKGGMGELYRARKAGPGGYQREVALKLIRLDLKPADQEFLTQSFIEEAKLASKLQHANLIHVYEFGQDGDILFLAMELVEGCDLSAVTTRPMDRAAGHLEPRYVVHIAEQVCRGLDYAHRLSEGGEPLKVVHRDVTPSNILISFDGAVKLADFGIAWMRRSPRLAAELTRSGVIKGKTSYMAPEYILTRAADARADIFSLGVVLWEGLTGARLFGQPNESDRIQQILKGSTAPPSSRQNQLPKELDEIVLRALEREPDKRFQTARELATRLRDFALAKGWLVDDVDLGKVLRRRFPSRVPATALDLRGLSDQKPQTPEDGTPTPILVRTGDILREPAEPSESRTAERLPVTEPGFARLPLEPTAPSPVQPPAPAPAPNPVAAAVPAPVESPREEPTAPRLQPPLPLAAPAVVETARPAPPPAVEPRLPWRTAGAVALGVALLGGLLLWSQPRDLKLPAPIERPDEASAAPRPPTATPTPAQAAIPPLAPVPTVTPPPAPSVAAPARPEPGRGASAPPAPPPTRHRPAPSRHLKPGTLAVVAIDPWVQIFVDGKDHGYSPNRGFPVSAGRHRVSLRNDEMGLRRDFTVFMPEDGHLYFMGELDELKPIEGLPP